MASRLATFLSELKRRKVYHVAVGYSIVGFGVASGAQYVFEIMGFGLAPARLVAVLVILGLPIALVLAWAYEVRPERPQESHPDPELKQARRELEASVAVLPFVDLSPCGDQQFFCDGMAEELINVLAKEEKLLVVSRTSSFVFREGSEDAREIGRKLGVATILEGSVRRAADRIRVTAQLVNADDGFHLWSDTYDRALNDVFGVQDEIARSILQALLPKFVADYSDRPSSLITPHIQAYDLFMKGREAHFTYTEEGSERALDYFSRAIQQSPAWAAPYSAQAEAYAMLLFHGTLPPERLLPKVRVSAERAVELDSTAGDGLALLGVERAIGRHDWVGAEADLLSAISLSPNGYSPRMWYGVFLLPALGRHEEAMEQAALSAELDPLSPAAVADRLWVSLQAREYDDALVFGERALGMAPGFPFAVSGVAMVYEVLGNLKKAAEAHQTAVAVTQGHPFYRTQLARCYALAGRTSEARQILTGVTEEWEHKYASPYYLATAFQALDEPETAFYWLHRAYETKDPWLVFLGEDPIIDPLRANPELGDLLRQMSLPQADGFSASSRE